MAGTVLVGTSGWSYPSGQGTWNGIFYPKRRGRGFDELAYYAEHFDTVEVNSTFYRAPDAGMTASWLRRTPPGFLFSIKLYQKFTHPEMFLARNGVADWNLSLADVDQVRHGIEPMAASGRLAAMLMQFPPSFHATPDTRDYLAWLLRAFPGYPKAVELRHRSWSDAADETRQQLRDHDAAWALIDEPKFESSVSQAPDDHASGALSYIRLHGRNAEQWWDHAAAEDRYNYLYSADELRPFAAAATEAAAAGRRVVLYLNNHFSAKAVANAAVLRSQLDQPVPGAYPPEIVARYPSLRDVVRTDGLPL